MKLAVSSDKQLPAQTNRDGVRVDIQWLRALAVSLVLVYHLWPSRVTGGFIGVDVFFVISGFLITTHLIKTPPQRAHDLVVFWGRRIRRLLPAAFTVIVVTVIAALVFLPNTQWEANGLSAITAALYVENWHLALTSVDYLAATDLPTALQHYWSLSVEEQFYLFWPILILIAWFISRRRPGKFRAVSATVIITIVAASLAYSIYHTLVNPSSAYFVTPTRIWELGLGGGLAVFYPWIEEHLRQRPVVKVSLIGLGTMMIIATGFYLSGDNFPGWIAAIPVLGAALVIGAGPADYLISLDRYLKWRPVQFIGDASYSIYLWHWPIALILPYAVGRPTWPTKLAVIALTIALSWLSKTFIEDRFRGQHPLGVPLRRTFIFLLVGMVVTAGVGAGAILYTRATAGSSQPPVIMPDTPCAGAAMLLDPTCQGQDPHGQQLFMTPRQAAVDRGVTFMDNCRWNKTDPKKIPFCQFGSTDTSATQVALFGNSHAAQFLEPLLSLAATHDWGVHTYLANSCWPALLPLNFSDPAARRGCLDYTSASIADMKDSGIKLVVMAVQSQSIGLADVPKNQQTATRLAMNTDLLNLLVSHGFNVLVIHDTPFPPDTVTDCVAEHLDNLSLCDGPLSQRLKRDPLYDSATALENPHVTTLDLTNAFCDSDTCFDVIGGVIVYFNQGHMTATFAKTLAPYLESAVVAAVEN